MWLPRSQEDIRFCIETGQAAIVRILTPITALGIAVQLSITGRLTERMAAALGVWIGGTLIPGRKSRND